MEKEDEEDFDFGYQPSNFQDHMLKQAACFAYDERVLNKESKLMESSKKRLDFQDVSRISHLQSS